MESKIRHTPETVLVFPIDMEKLNIKIDEFFHSKGDKPDTSYHANGILALMRNPKSCIIDDEFVGHDISDKIIFYVYEDELQSGGNRIYNCLPTYEVTFTLQEVKSYLKPAITLAEFTKGRRGYNARIKSNESEWVRYLNK